MAQQRADRNYREEAFVPKLGRIFPVQYGLGIGQGDPLRLLMTLHGTGVSVQDGWDSQTMGLTFLLIPTYSRDSFIPNSLDSQPLKDLPNVPDSGGGRGLIGA